MPASAMPTRNSASRYLAGLPGTPTESLFRRWQHEGDPAAREALALRYLPLARQLAHRYARSSVSREELMQVASLALVKAIARFDPDHGSPFEAFALPTILGELRRYFRDATWSVHVTRAAQERALAIDDASARLINRLGRSPTVQDIASYLELSEEEVLDGLLAAQAYTTTSLDAPRQTGSDEDGAAPLADEIGAEDERYELVEAKAAVAAAVGGLSEEEREILRLRFAEELSQTEIAARLGVSQMQVSRLLRGLLQRLSVLAGADQG
jgi:RNA polymerase sigma-B factor